MTDKEIKEVLGLALEVISFEIEKKCRYIVETRASHVSIESLYRLIQQFLELHEKWNAISGDDD